MEKFIRIFSHLVDQAIICQRSFNIILHFTAKILPIIRAIFHSINFNRLSIFILNLLLNVIGHLIGNLGCFILKMLNANMIFNFFWDFLYVLYGIFIRINPN